MLGAIDQGTLIKVLDAIVARDAARALAIADEMNAHSISFAQAMRDLASLLHRLALIQQVAGAADDELDADDLRRLASALAPDEVQLFYQIALHGRNEMHLAPDEYAGFTMALMRMLAFAPTDAPPRSSSGTSSISTSAATSRAARSQPEIPVQVVEVPKPTAPPSFGGDWTGLVARLKVSGLVRELAQRSGPSYEGDSLKLRVPLKTLLDAGALQKLQTAVSEALGRPMRLAAEVGNTVGPTSAGIADQARAERQRQAEESIYADPFVRELIENFGASVDPTSIRPRSDNERNDSETEKTP